MNKSLLPFICLLMGFHSFGQGNALDFDGSGDLVSLGTVNFYASKFTIEGWFNTSSTGTNSSIFTGYTGSNIGIYLSDNASNEKLRFLVRNPPAGSGGVEVTSTTSVTDENWHHFAAVKGDDDKLYLYIDANLEASSAATISDFGATSLGFDIGRLLAAVPRIYSGALDEIRLWNFALSASDVSSLYNDEFSDPTTPASCLVAYYQMSNGSGSSLTDDSGNGNTGTITGATWTTSAAGVSSQSAPTCSALGLPVELTGFDARLLGEAVLLHWSTASETNNEGFEMEHSTDGRHWDKKGFLAGRGTTFETQSYHFTDHHPRPGLNYYRLKQVDFDGQFEYSKTISVEVNTAGIGISLFPNPANNSVILALESGYTGEARLILYDLLGKQLKTQSLLLEGRAFRASLDLSGLPGGVYLTEVQAGRVKWQERLVVE